MVLLRAFGCVKSEINSTIIPQRLTRSKDFKSDFLNEFYRRNNTQRKRSQRKLKITSGNLKHFVQLKVIYSVIYGFSCL